MAKDKRTAYATSVSLAVVLLSALVLPHGGSSKILAAILLLVAAVALPLLLKKRSIPHLERREVLLVMSVMGVLYVILYYLTGLYFGFSNNRDFITLSSVWEDLVPTVTVIITIEIVRGIFLAQESKFAGAMAYCAALCAELLLLCNVHEIKNVSHLMDFVAMTLFPAVTANLLYTFLSKRYGAKPAIIYRLVTSLFPFFIPYVPAIPDALYAFVKLCIPILILLFVRAMYEKRRHYALKKTSKWTYVGVGALMLVMISIVMLISCQFRFGALVIATESMTGDLNKGDVAIFEQYEDQDIQVGQVLVFKKGMSRVVHRVVEIQHVDGETRYFTQGDANSGRDYGHITKANIVGVVHLKVAYVGYPTLWLRELFY